jgi:hypothetical protein
MIKSTCKKCNTEFFQLKNGYIKEFCSRHCANSHVQTDAQNISRSRKLTKKRIHICPSCKKEFLTSNRHTYCSRKCVNIRRREILSEKRKYRIKCQFKFNLYDYPGKFDLDLIKKYGWYKAKNRGNNINGVSRDHVVSIDYGFRNNVFPEIISHPANCKLVRNIENVNKATKSGITYEELLDRI